ncbi:MAG: hypothetical protein J6A75_07085 [Lachnospiraceae bacterium]|nr:hypothetical protein [Lachnospiraceae bacterium]
MGYTLIINSRSYNLPKKNIKIMEKLDEALKIDETNLSVRQKYERMYRIVKDIVGEENAKEMFGSDNLDEIDTSDIALAVLKINDAYDAPISEYQTEKMQGKINSIPTEKLASLGKSVQSIASIQGLSK